MPLRDLILIAIVFGSIPYIFRKPWIGIIMWSWISYMNPHRFTWGFAYDFPVAQVIAGALFLSMLLTKEKLKLPQHPIVAIWLVFLLWMNITAVFALNPSGAFEEWDRCMKIQLVTFCTMLLIKDRYRITALVWTIALSIGFFGVKGGIYAIRTGFKWSVLGPPHSFIGGNNEIAFALLLVIPLMRFLQLQLEKRWQRRCLTGMIMLCLLSVLSSYSRGALLALGMMGLFLVWKSRQRVLLLLIAVLAIAVVVVVLPQRWHDRMSTIETYQQDSSAMGRINAWHFAWNLAKDRPIFGGGYRAFTPQLFYRYAPNPRDFHDAHSIYFEILGEQGFPGLLLFLGLFASAYLTAGRTGRRCQKNPELKWAADLAAMLQVCLICYGTGGAFLGLAYFDLPYHIVALTILLHGVVNEKLGSATRAADTATDAGHGQAAGREPGGSAVAVAGVRRPVPNHSR